MLKPAFRGKWCDCRQGWGVGPQRGTIYPLSWLTQNWICKRLIYAVSGPYVAGVSTRKVEKLIEAMGAKGMSKSEVSRLAMDLDVEVTAFRERPLDGAYRYIWLDAMYAKVREGQRVVGLEAMFAVCDKHCLPVTRGRLLATMI